MCAHAAPLCGAACTQTLEASKAAAADRVVGGATPGFGCLGRVVREVDLGSAAAHDRAIARHPAHRPGVRRMHFHRALPHDRAVAHDTQGHDTRGGSRGGRPSAPRSYTVPPTALNLPTPGAPWAGRLCRKLGPWADRPTNCDAQRPTMTAASVRPVDGPAHSDASATATYRSPPAPRTVIAAPLRFRGPCLALPDSAATASQSAGGSRRPASAAATHRTR